MSKRPGFVYATLSDANRDRVTVMVPKPLTKKAYEALQAAVSRAAAKTLGARTRRKRAR